MKKRIKELRLKKGLSQSKLAKLSGKSQANMSKLESDQINATEEDFASLSEILDVHPAELVDHPAWRNMPPSNIHEDLMRRLLVILIKWTQDNKKLTPELAATAIITLYKRHASGFNPKLPSAKHLEAELNLLIAPNRGKRS